MAIKTSVVGGLDNNKLTQCDCVSVQAYITIFYRQNPANKQQT